MLPHRKILEIVDILSFSFSVSVSLSLSATAEKEKRGWRVPETTLVNRWRNTYYLCSPRRVTYKWWPKKAVICDTCRCCLFKMARIRCRWSADCDAFYLVTERYPFEQSTWMIVIGWCTYSHAVSIIADDVGPLSKIFSFLLEFGLLTKEVLTRKKVMKKVFVRKLLPCWADYFSW